MMNSLSRQARICAALCHLAGAIWLTVVPLVGGGVLTSGIPVPTWILGLVVVLSLLLPCLTWLLTRRVHDFVDRAGREAVNAQLSLLLYGGCAAFVTAIACGMNPNMYTASPLGVGVGMLMFFLVPFSTAVYTIVGIVAAIQALGGNVLVYPVIIRFIPNP